MSEQPAGYRYSPHTADLMIEAWGATRDEAFEQAARGSVAAFAEARGPATATHTVALPAADTDALLALLEEIVFLADARAQAPVAISVDGRTAAFELGTLDHGTITGALPKAITYHALAVEQHADGWRCRVVVDV